MVQVQARAKSRRHGRVGTVLLATVAIGATGCRTVPRPATGPPTQLDRLIRHYPELADGRFAVIADFEDPRHFQIVQLMGTTDVARRSLDASRGIEETGGGCLLFTSGSPNDAIVLSNRAASDWFLKQDWRPYDLLLANVNSPRAGLTLELQIFGGSGPSRQTARTLLTLEKGWNHLRLDVAEIGEHVPLDDVQELRLSVSTEKEPVEIALDDVVLTSFRKKIAGSADAAGGGLFVEQVGRQWRIGSSSGGRGFELTFAGGQIVGWHNLNADPYRLKNVLAGGSLSFMPVLTDGERVTPLLSKLAAPLSVYSRVVEANEVRAIVATEWRSARSRGGGSAVEATYTVYASGQVGESFGPEAMRNLSWALELPTAWRIEVSEAGQPLRAVAGADSEEPLPTAGGAFASAYHAEGDASLLIVPGARDASLRPMKSAPDSTQTGTSAMHVLTSTSNRDSQETGGPRSTQWHFYLGAGELAPREAAQRASGYQNPPGAQLQVGRIDRRWTEPGDSSGFDRVLGCLTAEADEGVARFVLDGSTSPIFTPAIRVAGPADRPFWVYRDHMLLGPTSRDVDGGVLVQLPDVVREPTMVEVFFEVTP
jgi:hypothetical protein